MALSRSRNIKFGSQYKLFSCNCVTGFLVCSRQINSCLLPVVHHPGYVCSLPPNHRFPMKKFGTLFRNLLKIGIVSSDSVYTPSAIPVLAVSEAHNARYVDKFLKGKTTPEEQRVSGFQWSYELANRVQLECGGTLLTCELALQHGISCNTAGGTHHAHYDSAKGFCLLNDLAIAARQMTLQGLKVLIVDLDVHHGDGTAAILEKDNKIFTFSMHSERIFPLKKPPSDLDVALPQGTRDDDYLRLLTDHLPSILANFRPSIILYDAGVDVHRDDTLGDLQLSNQGIYRRDLYVLRSAASKGIPIATVIGGGYSACMQTLGERHSLVHIAASQIWNSNKMFAVR